MAKPKTALDEQGRRVFAHWLWRQIRSRPGLAKLELAKTLETTARHRGDERDPQDLSTDRINRYLIADLTAKKRPVFPSPRVLRTIANAVGLPPLTTALRAGQYDTGFVVLGKLVSLGKSWCKADGFEYRDGVGIVRPLKKFEPERYAHSRVGVYVPRSIELAIKIALAWFPRRGDSLTSASDVFEQRLFDPGSPELALLLSAEKVSGSDLKWLPPTLKIASETYSQSKIDRGTRRMVLGELIHEWARSVSKPTYESVFSSFYKHERSKL